MDAGCPLMTPFFVLSSQSNTSLYINSAIREIQSKKITHTEGDKKKPHRDAVSCTQVTDFTIGFCGNLYKIFHMIIEVSWGKNMVQPCMWNQEAPTQNRNRKRFKRRHRFIYAPSISSAASINVAFKKHFSERNINFFALQFYADDTLLYVPPEHKYK